MQCEGTYCDSTMVVYPPLSTWSARHHFWEDDTNTPPGSSTASSKSQSKRSKYYKVHAYISEQLASMQTGATANLTIESAIAALMIEAGDAAEQAGMSRKQLTQTAVGYCNGYLDRLLHWSASTAGSKRRREGP